MSSLKKALVSAGVAVIAVLGASGSAQAFDFECANSAGSCTSVASWNLSGGLLTISNKAGASNGSFISGVSFDVSAGQSVSLAAVQGPGVAYTVGGGANIPSSLGWSIDYEVKPDGKPATNSIHAGESLAFNVAGVTLADIASGGFKFGIHVQALPGGASEKLVNVTAVPEAETSAMVLAGLAVAAGALRRRARA